MMMLKDDGADIIGTEPDAAIDELKTWLTPQDEFEYRTLGKALSFVAIFENTFEKCFTAEGWTLPRKLFEQVIEEQPNAGMVKTATESLAQMPQRQEDWERIGNSWNEAKSQISFEMPLKK